MKDILKYLNNEERLKFLQSFLQPAFGGDYERKFLVIQEIMDDMNKIS